MKMNFPVKSFSCEYIEFGADDDGDLAITLCGDFPAVGKMTGDEAMAVVSSAGFFELFRIADEQAAFGTPLWGALQRAKRGGTITAQFKESDASPVQ
ncbi:hypothetical protein [Phycobacter azelaicus]|uniref:hypothetical protein n=1 Tax=Phycobacter azelaicus TaxID=2668075 RepID=UPI001867F4E4|nr:hypothetical protein [Phycobacter azelaicus]